MSNILPVSITAPGFYGLNLQDSSIDLPVGFAQTAINCVIDKYGRIGSRQGWSPVNSTSVALGTANVQALFELVALSGASYDIVCGNNKLFTLSGGVLTELTYGGGGVAPTITASNWQIASLNGIAYLFQSGHDPLVFDPATSTTTYKRVSEVAGYSGTVPQANCVISAYGRLWAANTVGDKTTVAFSDLLGGMKWTGGTSGSINLSNVWPNGGDEITAIGAHNGFIIFFGKRQILIYTGATTPSTMSLSDAIDSVGCVARDSVQNIGTDLLFLSGAGVKSLARTIQEKSSPIHDVSKNVRDHLIQDIRSENVDLIKSVYSDVNSFYLLTFPTVGETYCFDTKMPLPDGALRVTTWSLMPKAMCARRDKTLYLGLAGYIGNYTGYIDNTSTYTMSYYTNNMTFGDPNQESILKKIGAVIIGGNGQAITVRYAYNYSTNYNSQIITLRNNVQPSLYGVAEYGIGQYSFGIITNTVSTNVGGSGKVVQVAFDTTINGYQVSYQKIDIYAKNGKIVM